MKFVRYTRRYDFRPRQSVVVARKEGDEVKITEAEYEAANAAGAVEIINGESAEQATASAETGGTASGSKGSSRPRNSARG
jgi:hypothetical protein